MQVFADIDFHDIYFFFVYKRDMFECIDQLSYTQRFFLWKVWRC